MKTATDKKFDSVKFSREIKEKIGAKLSKMTLEEQKKYLKKIRSGEIKLS